MANICFNELYASSEIPENINYISEFLQNELHADVYNEDKEIVEANFDSRWAFPKEKMESLYEGLPNKDDIYMRCLSVEYGNDYVAYHKCDEHGWWNEGLS